MVAMRARVCAWLSPDIGVYNLCRQQQRDEDHRKGVPQRAVEGVKEARVRKHMMRLMRLLVELGAEALVFQVVHHVLEEVLADHLLRHRREADSTLEAVV